MASEHARTAFAFVIATCITGCASYKYYDTTLARLDYAANERQARIQVSDPQLYKREHLINERRDEMSYLTDLLNKSRTVEFSPELIRDIEAVSALSAQVGVSFDQAARAKYAAAASLAEIEAEVNAAKLQVQLAQLKKDLAALQSGAAAPAAAAATTTTTTTSPASTSTTTTTSPAATTASGGSPAATTSSATSGLQGATPGLGDAKDLATRLEAMIGKLGERLDKTSTGPRAASAGVSPRELFQDRQAYRRDIQAAINATSLDTLHDYDSNSLFRMQFRATVMPGDANDQLGVLEMRIKGPSAADAAEFGALIDRIYLEWLDHATRRLNGVIGGDMRRPDPATLLLGAVGKLFYLVPVRVPRHPGAKCEIEVRLDFTPPPAACHELLLALPVGFNPHRAQEFVNDLQPGENKLEELDAAFIKLRTHRGAECKAGIDDTIYWARDTLNIEPMVNYLLRALTTLSAQADSSAPHVVMELSRLTQRASHLVQMSRELWSRVGLKCGFQDLRTGQYEIPDGFIKALYLRDAPNSTRKYIPLGRVSTYAVSPTALAQKVSSAARAADAIQIAASLAGALPTLGLGANAGLGYMRSVTGKVDAFERMPLVVGYSMPNVTAAVDAGEGASFGWLLGPKVVMDPERKALALEHNLAPYELTVDVSLPGWWPFIDIETHAAWAPNWRAGDASVIAEKNTAASRVIRVPLRHNQGDLDGITALLLSTANNGARNQRVQTAGIEAIEPASISICAERVTFLVRGNNIWRAQNVYLLGQEGKDITVLPDMAGVSAAFDIMKLPPLGAGQHVLLTVATPDGTAAARLEVTGKRTLCGKEEAPPRATEPDDEGGPFIATTMPATVYACDRSPRLVIRGKNLDDASISIQLGAQTAAVKSIVKGKVIEATFASPIGARDNRQSIPLIVTTAKGAASRDIPVERNDCADGSPARLVLAAAPPGALNVCSDAPVVMALGADAHAIQTARIQIQAGSVEAEARSVTTYSDAQAAEMVFANVGKEKAKDLVGVRKPVPIVMSLTNKRTYVGSVAATCETK